MKYYLLILCLFVVGQCFSEPIAKDTSHKDENKRLQTDVFILNCCSPNQVSIQRANDDTGKNKYVPIRKLSINTNKFSAFKVVNINPLRYNYSVNNEFISQFFDASDIAFGKFKTDTSNLPLSDIEVLEVFNKDTIKETQQDKLQKSKANTKLYHDSLNTINIDWSDALNTAKENKVDYDDHKEVFIPKGIKSKKIADSLNKVKDKIFNDYAKQYQNLENEVEDFSSIIENLTVNNDIKAILEDIKLRYTDSNYAGLQTIEKTISAQADSVKSEIIELDNLLNLIPALLFNIHGTDSTDFENQIDRLADQLKKVKRFTPNKAFTIDVGKLKINNSTAPSDQDVERKIEIYKIKEFASTEKLKITESFVVFVSLQIGKLLQDEVIDCSRFQNILSVETCLDTIQKQIDTNIQRDNAIYRYIQDISANLNVFIKFLQLNNPAFTSTVSNINTNYQTLLKFIKTLDFVNKNNTKEFTLPIHNNLKNVDLVRYYVERRDKIRSRIESYNYDIWIKGGFKVDFSVAILMSQITGLTYNKVPYYDSITDTAGIRIYGVNPDTFILKKANQGKYAFAFGGMVNIMLRSGASWITPGISVGIAYSTSQKLQFTLAGSLQFGKSERIIMHYGITSGLAQRLDLSQYNISPNKSNADTYMVRGKISDATVSYIDKYIFRPFFGISYNLSKKNALNAIGTGGDYYKSQYPSTQ